MKGHAAAVLLMTCLSGNVLAAPMAKDQASASTKVATNPEAPSSIDPAVLASILKSLPTSDLAKLLGSSSGSPDGPAGATPLVTGPVGGATSGLAGPLDGATGGSLAPVTGTLGGLPKAVKRAEAAQQDSPLSALDISALSGLLSGGSSGAGGLGGLTKLLGSSKRDEAAGSPLDSILRPVTGLLKSGKRDEAAQQDSPLSALDIAALRNLLSGDQGGAGGLGGVTKGLTGPLDGATGGSLPLGSTLQGVTGAI